VVLVKEIQESMGIVLPQDGHTKPYLILRDRTDRMAYFYQVRDQVSSDREQRDIYHLRKRFAAYGGSPGDVSHETLVRDISRLTFTASGSGGVLVSLQVMSGGRDYTIFTLIRLKALYSLEAI